MLFSFRGDKYTLICLKTKKSSKFNIHVLAIVAYEFDIEKGNAGDYSGPVTVRHYGLFGKICSEGWDDTDAQVICS